MFFWFCELISVKLFLVGVDDYFVWLVCVVFVRRVFRLVEFGMSFSLLCVDFLCLYSGSDGKKSKGKYFEVGL